MEKYIKIKNTILKDNIEFDIYIYIPFKNKYLKYLNAGEKLGKDKLNYLQAINLNKQYHFYTDINSYFNFKKNNINIDDKDIVDDKFYELNEDNFIKAKKSNYENEYNVVFSNLEEKNDNLVVNNLSEENILDQKSNNNKNLKEELDNIINSSNLDKNFNKSKFDNSINDLENTSSNFSNYDKDAIDFKKIKTNIINKDLDTTNFTNVEESIEIQTSNFSNLNESKIKYYNFEDEKFIKKLDDSEFEKLLKDKNIPNEEKEILISNVLKNKDEQIIKKFTNVIKTNLKYYEFDQIDNFNKTIKRQQEKIYINEEEIKELGNKINERVVLDINNIDDFKIKIKHLFINLNEAKTNDIEKILLEFTEFTSSVIEEHDKDSNKVILAKPIDDICFLLSEKFNSKDYLIDHSIIVSVLATCIGIILESSDTKFLRDLSIGGILHDLGFIRIPDLILKKILNSETLNAEELKLYKTHNTESYNIVSKVPTISLISDIVIRIILQHHENPSKDGFPNQKSIMTHPIQVKIIAISDLISYKIQNNTFTSFHSELNKLFEFQNSNTTKIYDLKLIKQILNRL